MHARTHNYTSFPIPSPDTHNIVGAVPMGAWDHGQKHGTTHEHTHQYGHTHEHEHANRETPNDAVERAQEHKHKHAPRLGCYSNDSM